MAQVRPRRRTGQRTRRPKLDFTDPAAVAAWLTRLDGAARDIIAAAEDQVRPLPQRDLGPRAAGAIVTESAASLSSLIAYARAGLPAE